MAFPGGPCVASLVYTVRLMQEGTLRYTYQYPDDDAIFEFQVKNHFFFKSRTKIEIEFSCLN